MRITATVLMASAMLALGCASHLEVRTEVYDGDGLVTAKPFAARAADRARATRKALDDLDTTVTAQVTDEFVRTIATLKQTVPKAVPGTAEEFRDSYMRGIHERTLQTLQPEIDHIRAKASTVESKALGGAANDELRADLVSLQVELQRLTDDIQMRVDQVTAAEQNTFVRVVNLNAAALQDEALAQATGLDVKTSSDKAAAVKFLAHRAELAVLDAGEAVGRALLAPVESAKSATTETLVLPLGDPNVARIIGTQTKDHWRQYVNDVTTTNWFGNSEAAFRMEGLGENHLKSVLFDPSEVTKVGLNVFSNTLRVTAAAYGFALPQGEKKDDQGNVTETIPANTTKAAIDAEISRIRGDRSVRSLKMEQLFWKSADAAAKVSGTPGDDASADAVTAIADLIDCMADEIEKPQTKKCGGN